MCSLVCLKTKKLEREKTRLSFKADIESRLIFSQLFSYKFFRKKHLYMPICNGRVLTCTCTVSVCTMYIVQYSSQARRHSLIHPYWPLQKFFTHFWTYCSLQALIKEGFIQKTRQRSSLLFRGYNLFNSLPRLLFSTRTIRRQG